MDLLKRCNDADLSQLYALKIASRTIGHVRYKLGEALISAEPDLFRRADQSSLMLNVNGLSPEEITDRVAAMHERLAAEGTLPKPGCEITDVRTHLADPPLFRINRTLIFPFGIKSWGVHLIIILTGGDIVVARRSDRVCTFRGCYDVPVGGLLPSGKDPWSHVLDEASEEAGLPADSVRPLGGAVVLAYRRNVMGHKVGGQFETAFPFETDGGTNWDEVFYWIITISRQDLLTPRDGEVKMFHRMTPIELINSLRDEPDVWKVNSGVIFADMLARDPSFSHHFSAEDHAYLRRLRIADPRPEGTHYESHPS